MTIEEKKSEGYITLKEAGELFGYSADYIGQLIRKGKIEGKQVYANVAWVTTKDALEEYLAREKKEVNQNEMKFGERVAKFALSDQAAIFAVWTLRVLIPILVAALIMIFYFVSISIDHRLANAAQQKLEMKSVVAAVGAANAGDQSHMTYEK